jgi:hypothetical protein
MRKCSVVLCGAVLCAMMLHSVEQWIAVSVVRVILCDTLKCSSVQCIVCSASLCVRVTMQYSVLPCSTLYFIKFLSPDGCCIIHTADAPCTSPTAASASSASLAEEFSLEAEN